ncbi:DegT/DnrJ/EryC1/StrS family aminotransferase [Thalassobacillus hwangdonensis]|uniref:DegT/DnrJ/EryC1/StrS family aminotransferase n=1 Tax=Thalassobacillus hwangdonensis TaxID=546108 RepID=A0ABW3L6M7_9BACI
MSRIPERIHLAAPHMTGMEQFFIKEAFDTNWIAPLGPNVDGFENEVAEYVGVNHALALNSGTAAIHLALRVLDVGPGDVVFCPSLTFVASANPILYQGAEPVFIDSEPETWNMSPLALETALEDAVMVGRLPKAVIVVNLYGQSAKIEEIMELCAQYGVPVIEDAAESLGSSYKGRPSGSFGHFGIFSFNGNKIITTSGGGMLVSDDAEAMAYARHLSTQAKDPAPYYQHSEMGYNYRMSNIVAGIGRAQMKVLDKRVRQKRRIFKRYEHSLMDVPELFFQPEAKDSLHNRWLSTLLIDETCGLKPLDLVDALALENIEARPVWKPLHLQPLFEDCNYYPHTQAESISASLFEQGVCLPSGTAMTEKDQDRVIHAVRAYVGGAVEKKQAT